ncbi:hypothetical protein [Noviherbaspirillum saxi]|uniref:Uncharacterized protein n=1 Tax=Noviherbaspirillum saxi TaxID=2320863 RepID=A0A3A3G028_9BURK|nr:hypothetical protein [Noviherbaspirillum saxi]RJF92679.1 hypothetical protein D3871_29295 [Noviherbaspirillum saxi]
MLTIDDAATVIRAAFVPLVCGIERGRYNDSLKVMVRNADGNNLYDMGELRQSIFGQKAALISILRTVYHIKHGLLDNYLCQQLKKPSIKMRFA